MKKEIKEEVSNFAREAGGGCLLMFVLIFTILLIGLILSSLSSCRPQSIIPTQTSADTIYMNLYRVDSLVQHDSVYIKEQTSNDTVFIDRYRYRLLLRDRAIHDTLMQSKTDTITVTITDHSLSHKDELFGILGRLFVWIIVGLLFFSFLCRLIRR